MGVKSVQLAVSQLRHYISIHIVGRRSWRRLRFDLLQLLEIIDSSLSFIGVGQRARVGGPFRLVLEQSHDSDGVGSVDGEAVVDASGLSD